MHEMSLCEGILQVLESESKRQGFKQVQNVWLEIGALAGVEKEALLFSFDVVTKNSIAEQAKLIIVDIPGTAWCMQCSKSVAVNQRFDQCPDCGSYQLQITSGEEMKIKELEVD
ncbi:MAG TPA: hydrogenase maturation nickel metallochaperone HypA [Aeromonadales bacterium]|nr:hydrogenase maturation nickel metallochaperone HypA [Aeromonadales bacterium]